MKIQYLISKQQRQEMFQLRNEVFVVEQNVDPSLEIDQYDQPNPDVHYLGAYVNTTLVGTMRIREENNTWILQRIAVKKAFRNQSIGSQLMQFCITAAKNKNIQHIQLHAQLHALSFYTKLGFITVGEVFEEAKIKHIKVIYPL